MKRRSGGTKSVPSHGISALALLLLMALALGCDTSEGTDELATISQLIWGDERLLAPASPMPQQFLIFLPLYNPDVPDSPYVLSNRWTMSEDGRVWTFEIREDARWQDGTPVTAHDAAFTVELLGHPAIGYRDPSATRVEVIDDRTVRYHLDRPDPWSHQTVYPKHRLEDLDPEEFSEWAFWTAPIGNGAYRYERFIPKTMVELGLDPSWTGPRPPVERWRFLFSGEPAVLLESGEIDLSSDWDAVMLARHNSDLVVRWAEGEIWGHDMIWWNHNRPPLDDPRVRRALTLAIDRQALLALREFPADLPLVDVLVTNRQWRDRDFPEPLPHDPAAARSLLADAGWIDGDGNGVRESAGRELRLDVNVREDAVNDAVLIQEQLSRIGVAIEITTLEFFSWRNRKRRGLTDATIGPMNGDLPSTGRDMLDPVQTGYTNPSFARLVEAIDTAFVPGYADQLYRDTWPIFHQDVPVTLFRPYLRWTVVNRRSMDLWERHSREYWGNEGT